MNVNSGWVKSDPATRLSPKETATSAFQTMLATLPEETRQALAAQIPFPSRLGQPSEFAALAIHIVENSMLNGETIRLDGALRMAPKQRISSSNCWCTRA